MTAKLQKLKIEVEPIENGFHIEFETQFEGEYPVTKVYMARNRLEVNKIIKEVTPTLKDSPGEKDIKSFSDVIRGMWEINDSMCRCTAIPVKKDTAKNNLADKKAIEAGIAKSAQRMKSPGEKPKTLPVKK